MKKLIALVFALVMGLSVLTGCGDPVADDFEAFWNSDSALKIGDNLTAMSKELDSWSETDSEKKMKKSLEDKVIPKIDESLDLLKDAPAETDEVKAIKGKCEKMLVAYKDGLDLMLEGINKNDEKLIKKANTKLKEASDLVNDFDKASKKLAEEKGIEFEE